MEVETSLNALMCALSRAYSADSCLSTSYGTSSSLRKAARDATLLLFDTNIAGLGDVLKQVNSSITTLAISIRRARNSLCDINRLPVEIFHAIFRFVSEPSQEPFAEHPPEISSNTHLHPLRLSQVCAHWRAIALEQRKLWSRLDTTTMSKACLELFQKRAGDCLLTVACPVWYKTRWPEFWSESSARQRMKTMELALPPLGAHNNASTLFDSSSAPVLENLYLSNFGACMPLPHVFPGGTPRLQQLHVKGFNIEWRSGLYRNLTTLCLHDSRLAYMLPIGHLDDLLQMINDSPNLEQFEYSLVVHGRQPGTRPFENNLEFPEGFPPVLATASRILLGHLRKVRLVMPSSKSAAYILNRISFPTTVYGFDLNIWGPCDLEDLLHPDIIPPCLLQSMSEAIFDCTARSFESYSLTSYFAALERAECGAVRSGFLVCWSSDRPFYEGICEVARLLARDYPELPIRTQTINLGRVMPWAIADQLDDLTSPLAHNLLLRSAPLRTLRLTVDESIYLEELFDTIIEELDDTPACSHIAATFARWHGLTALEILDSPAITIREMDAATSLAQALNSSGRLESLAIMGCTIVADQDDTGNPGEQLDRISKRQSGLTQLNILYDDVTADAMRKLWDSKRG